MPVRWTSGFPAPPRRMSGALSTPGLRVGYLAFQTEKEPFSARRSATRLPRRSIRPPSASPSNRALSHCCPSCRPGSGLGARSSVLGGTREGVAFADRGRRLATLTGRRCSSTGRPRRSTCRSWPPPWRPRWDLPTSPSRFASSPPRSCRATLQAGGSRDGAGRRPRCTAATRTFLFSAVDQRERRQGRPGAELFASLGTLGSTTSWSAPASCPSVPSAAPVPARSGPAGRRPALAADLRPPRVGRGPARGPQSPAAPDRLPSPERRQPRHRPRRRAPDAGPAPARFAGREADWARVARRRILVLEMARESREIARGPVPEPMPSIAETVTELIQWVFPEHAGAPGRSMAGA